MALNIIGGDPTFKIVVHQWPRLGEEARFKVFGKISTNWELFGILGCENLRPPRTVWVPIVFHMQRTSFVVALLRPCLTWRSSQSSVSTRLASIAKRRRRSYSVSGSSARHLLSVTGHGSKHLLNGPSTNESSCVRQRSSAGKRGHDARRAGAAGP